MSQRKNSWDELKADHAEQSATHAMHPSSLRQSLLLSMLLSGGNFRLSLLVSHLASPQLFDMMCIVDLDHYMIYLPRVERINEHDKCLDPADHVMWSFQPHSGLTEYNFETQQRNCVFKPLPAPSILGMLSITFARF